MSEIVCYSFNVDPSDVEKWENVFSVLELGHTGAKFQWSMEVFGEKVSKALDSLIDENGSDWFIFEGWFRENDTIFFKMDMDPYLITGLSNMLAYCNITNIEIQILE